METNLRQALERLWGSGEPTLSPDGSATVQHLQDRYRLHLPQDFATYLREASPNIDWTDEHGITWWSPERIKNLPDECRSDTPDSMRNREIELEASSYLVFADFLIWSYAYAICCSDGPNRGKVALIGVEPDRFVASSFSAFVDLAANDSKRIHSPVGDHYSDLI